MNALRLHARGGPEQLFLDQAPLPEPGRGEVRITVYAAGLTPTELQWDETYRAPDGRERIPSIPGHDVSGVIDKVGSGASGVEPGEAVYGLLDVERTSAAAHRHSERAMFEAFTGWRIGVEEPGDGDGPYFIVSTQQLSALCLLLTEH